MRILSAYINSFTELFFPRICYACGDHLLEHEEEICNRCLRALPRTGFELTSDNPVGKVFWGRVKLEKAASLYYYRKGEMLQQLLHRLKYKGHYQLGQVLGRQLGKAFTRSGFMEGIDLIIPVPLHKKKLRQRGYNQSEHIALGIAEVSGISVVKNILIRTVHNPSQTFKGRFERWENVKGIFMLTDPGAVEGKHVLLVDDVITTGATLESCAEQILQCKNAKVSVASLGYADF